MCKNKLHLAAATIGLSLLVFGLAIGLGVFFGNPSTGAKAGTLSAFGSSIALLYVPTSGKRCGRRSA